MFDETIMLPHHFKNSLRQKHQRQHDQKLEHSDIETVSYSASTPYHSLWYGFSPCMPIRGDIHECIYSNFHKTVMTFKIQWKLAPGYHDETLKPRHQLMGIDLPAKRPSSRSNILFQANWPNLMVPMRGVRQKLTYKFWMNWTGLDFLCIQFDPVAQYLNFKFDKT